MSKKQPLILREFDFFILSTACPRQNDIMLNILKNAISLSFLFYVAVGEAQDKGSKGGLFQRASHKETKRWSLQEWLETKERNRMMDLWLAVNSPSPYEGMFSLANHGYQTKVSPADNGPTYSTISGQAAAYASLIGLSVEYNKNEQENFNDLTGLFNLRVFGNSIQSTNLTLHVGQRTRTLNQAVGDVILRNNLGQVSMQLYLNKYFGLDGLYRQYQEISEPTFGDVKGQLSEAGLFIDFRSVRIFGSWYQDVQVNTLSGAETRIERNGVKSGIKIFF